ncbi:hypothetical protein [Parafrankia sp. BMG5.11]|uniref:hypothetical protein n=1 Tax=Parafrankia sp. BMG5.11 TaxID=222540 RepID=UPI00103CBE22|nr:hypothetical protein [Parafrankia sp. BMG5.11]TCJ34613.1 hypothetical protein E0504_31930 [Parafrankia sp. BMG5.11]
MTSAVATVGADAFIAGLHRCDIQTTVTASVVVFTVAAATQSGATDVETGVAVSELGAWPAVPPHWIHLPTTVALTNTNINMDETLPGWVRHSRQVAGWGDAEEPAQAWLAHVRSVLQEAA